MTINFLTVQLTVLDRSTGEEIIYDDHFAPEDVENIQRLKQIIWKRNQKLVSYEIDDICEMELS